MNSFYEKFYEYLLNISNNGFRMPRRMAADVYDAGRSGYVAGQGCKIDLETGGFSAEALRPYAESVNAR